ncbi:hypothetical protein BH09ACT1_BH09ACT1_18620 [soil metagenome]
MTDFESFGDDFGIGAQVAVIDVSEADPAPWSGEPTGIIVRSGGSALAGVWGKAVRDRVWVVEFDEPQWAASGDGPFTTAQVLERYLELAPRFDGDEPDSTEPRA